MLSRVGLNDLLDFSLTAQLALAGFSFTVEQLLPYPEARPPQVGFCTAWANSCNSFRFRSETAQ